VSVSLCFVGFRKYFLVPCSVNIKLTRRVALQVFVVKATEPRDVTPKSSRFFFDCLEFQIGSQLRSIETMVRWKRKWNRRLTTASEWKTRQQRPKLVKARNAPNKMANVMSLSWPNARCEIRLHGSRQPQLVKRKPARGACWRRQLSRITFHVKHVTFVIKSFTMSYIRHDAHAVRIFFCWNLHFVNKKHNLHTETTNIMWCTNHIRDYRILLWTEDLAQYKVFD